MVKAIQLSRQHIPAQACQTIVAATSVLVWCRLTRFLNEALVHHLLKIVVQGAGTNFVLPLRMRPNLLHDRVAVAILVNEGKKNVQHGRR
jgi:hypothetical protein